MYGRRSLVGPAAGALGLMQEALCLLDDANEFEAALHLTAAIDRLTDAPLASELSPKQREAFFDRIERLGIPAGLR